jgi:hypothetical protein
MLRGREFKERRYPATREGAAPAACAAARGARAALKRIAFTPGIL